MKELPQFSVDPLSWILPLFYSSICSSTYRYISDQAMISTVNCYIGTCFVAERRDMWGTSWTVNQVSNTDNLLAPRNYLTSDGVKTINGNNL